MIGKAKNSKTGIVHRLKSCLEHGCLSYCGLKIDFLTGKFFYQREGRVTCEKCKNPGKGLNHES